MNHAPILVTGGSGFVGRAVLESLRNSEFSEVLCLSRNVQAGSEGKTLPAGWSVINGDIQDVPSWSRHLPTGGTVLHLAALTGKGSPERHRSVNADGTRSLLAAAEKAGVRRFIFVSSIAAGFPDMRGYPYASAKAAAEEAVRASGLDWAIVRPTQVFGPGSPVLAGLRKLANGPVGIRFGASSSPMQPIHVVDLAKVLVRLLKQSTLGGATIEIGGPEVLSSADLLRRIRQNDRGRSGPWIPIPLGPVRLLLRLAEPVLLPILPVTAGQLAAFVAGNDGSTLAPLGAESQSFGMRDLNSMLAEGTGDA